MRCGARLAYEVLGGSMRVYRVVGGRRRFKYRCTSCGHAGENDGRARICTQRVEAG